MNKNIPQRRFKEFENKLSWIQQPLKQYYQFLKGRNLSLPTFKDYGNYYGIAYGHLYTEYNEVIKNVKYKTTDEGVISKKGDILFPGSSTVPNGTAQANALMLDNIHLGGDVIIARDVSDKNYPPFVSYLINAQHRKMFEITTGTTITHMYGKDLAELKYHFPEYEEQKQIGDFFQKLDNMIELQSKKIKKYELLKLSYLEKMFSVNKNKFPKLRFKKFENKAKWVKSSMSEFYQFSKGKNLLLSSFNELGGNYGIAYGHLYTEYNEVIKNVKYKTTDEGVISKKGDILFPGSSTVPNGTAQANALMLDNIHLGGDVIIARDVSSKNYPPFVSYLINAQHRKMFEITTGTTITHMYGKDIAKLEYHFPEYEEQKEIGYFFSKLENIIELQNEKLVKLKNLKQAYLNELFVN